MITFASGGRPRAEGATGSAVREAIAGGLPRYDPTVRAAHLATEEVARAEQEAAKTSADAAGRYGAKAGASDADDEARDMEEVIILPRMIVGGWGEMEEAAREPPVRLPRLVVRPKKGAKAEGFETPAARDERLVKKHLSALDSKVLNRFPILGKTNEERAREAEAIEENARVLGEMAELVELTEGMRDGSEAENEARKLRELYLDVFVGRPR